MYYLLFVQEGLDFHRSDSYHHQCHHQIILSLIIPQNFVSLNFYSVHQPVGFLAIVPKVEGCDRSPEVTVTLGKGVFLVWSLFLTTVRPMWYIYVTYYGLGMAYQTHPGCYQSHT